MNRISFITTSLLAGKLLLLCLLGCGGSRITDSTGGANSKTESGKPELAMPTMVRQTPLPFAQMSPLYDGYKNIGDVLDLSPDQRKQFDDIYDKHHAKLDQWFNQVAGGVRGYEVEWYDDYAKILCKRISGNPDFRLTSEQATELGRQERQLQREFETDLLTAIPKEKMEQWQHHRLVVLLLDYYERLI